MSSIPYFTVPKMLDDDPRYQKLSVAAKYLYARMRDTLKLSVMNGWKDKLGYYIKMTRERMARLLNMSLPTVRKILRELKAVGLIIDIRMGLTRCNRIYVQPLPGETEEDLGPKRRTPTHPEDAGEKAPAPSEQKQTTPSTEKRGFIPDRNALSPNKRNPSNPNPNDPNKRAWKWFITEGTKWFDAEGRMWQFIDGEVERYLYGDEHKQATLDLLAELAMA
ncbi:replication initiator protein A [Eubacteriales bacterium OttesenSCG-928-A19]|nr:replication initiator protein A [Eubacteriales bacterium OttesenSCG-928-A19]